MKVKINKDTLLKDYLIEHSLAISTGENIYYRQMYYFKILDCGDIEEISFDKMPKDLEKLLKERRKKFLFDKITKKLEKLEKSLKEMR